MSRGFVIRCGSDETAVAWLWRYMVSINAWPMVLAKRDIELWDVGFRGEVSAEWIESYERDMGVARSDPAREPEVFGRYRPHSEYQFDLLCRVHLSYPGIFSVVMPDTTDDATAIGLLDELYEYQTRAIMSWNTTWQVGPVLKDMSIGVEMMLVIGMFAQGGRAAFISEDRKACAAAEREAKKHNSLVVEERW